MLDRLFRVSDDPIVSLARAPGFSATRTAMIRHPAGERSLLSPTSRALLYSVIRATQPEHVVEIGTYAGGTAEVLAEALAENGRGTLHTVSPHDAERFGPTFATWPERLRKLTEVHCVPSMSFFMEAFERNIRAGVILVDGNHDYEYAAFDIAAAARIVTPGGYIFIDNISQPGPFLAAAEFVARNPEWLSCGKPLGRGMTKPFDKKRIFIEGTDFAVLQAPAALTITQTPTTSGEIGWSAQPLRGFNMELAAPPSGSVIKMQCIFRAFRSQEIIEVEAEAETHVYRSILRAAVSFRKPIHIEGEFLRRMAEPWFWTPSGEVILKEIPKPF